MTRFFKTFLSNLSNTRDFLDIHFPEKIQALRDFSTLQIAPSSHVKENLRQHYSDIVYSLKIANESGYIYVLLEHQSTVPSLMPFRMLSYQLAMMR